MPPSQGQSHQERNQDAELEQRDRQWTRVEGLVPRLWITAKDRIATVAIPWWAAGPSDRPDQAGRSGTRPKRTKRQQSAPEADQERHHPERKAISGPYASYR